MNEKDINKLVEQIKKADNVLIAVSSNPTVDELTSALGLTLMLNKNKRRATAIFSGNTPDVLQFLNPDKTFDTNVDGLRDFIITLDSKKADRVVTKAEGDMVKIYITPSGHLVSADDLEFSQGDYNVDLVIALGVANKDALDRALAAHGRILHNASVFSLTVGEQPSNLGGVNIHAGRLSSYAEILTVLAEKLDQDLPEGDETTMDKAVATALLTGIVAVTKRFSNRHTTPELMSLGSELMKLGANQQLIARELEKHEFDTVETEPIEPINKAVDLNKADGEVLDLKKSNAAAEQEKTAKAKSFKTNIAKNLKAGQKTELSSVSNIKVAPDFSNLEEYSAAQISAERQKVADSLANEIELATANENQVSSDDELAKKLEAVKKAPAVKPSILSKSNDAEVVFGKEVTEFLPNEPIKADLNDISQAVPENPEVLINSVTTPVSESLKSSDKATNEITPPVEPPVPPVPADFAMPPMPDFSKLDLVPPAPPVPPNFAMPMPPMPPEIPEVPIPATTIPVAAPAPLMSQPVQPVNESVILPSLDDRQVAPAPTTNINSAVMPDQVYPQPIDNAQFIIPE